MSDAAEVWRLTSPAHAPGLDGEGARLWGGRWNSPGQPMVYCASSLALAVLEVFVHLPPAMRRPDALPPLVAVALEVPGQFDTVAKGDPRSLGDAFLAARAQLALWVPSAVVSLERNLLLNPLHPAMSQVRVITQMPFALDPRMAS